MLGEPQIVRKPSTFRELGEVDIANILQMVDRLGPQVWKKEDAVKENRFPCFHHTRHIIFRFINSNRDPRVFYSNPIWQVFSNVLLPFMRYVVRQYEMASPEFPKVMLASLEAGQVIDEHVDGAGSNLRTHKIHVPLQTNPDVLMTINGEAKHLEQGVAYEVNNTVRHGVKNPGSEDRIHFIFEVYDGGAI